MTPAFAFDFFYFTDAPNAEINKYETVLGSTITIKRNEAKYLCKHTYHIAMLFFLNDTICLANID